MSDVVLYIAGQRCDMFQDENISITKKISDFKDVNKIFTNFTKSFNLPASPTNNEIFGYYYNIDASGAFDPHQEVEALLECNGITIDEGTVELLNVVTKRLRPETYSVVFYGKLAELKNTIGDDTLDVLDISALDHLLTKDNVKDSWDLNLLSGNVVYPLCNFERPWVITDSGTDQRDITTPNNGISVSELKPAVNLKYLWDKIFDHYGFTYESDLIDSSGVLDNLYMLMHREAGDLNVLGYENDYYTEVEAIGGVFTAGDTAINFVSTVKDDNGNFDLGTDEYSFYAKGSYRFELTLPSIQGFPSNAGNDPPQILASYDSGSTWQIISYTVFSTFKRVVNLPMRRGTGTGTIKFGVRVPSGSSVSMGSPISLKVTGPSYKYDQSLDMSAMFPKDFKITDFINSVGAMFNLLIEPISSTSFKIENRREYYNQGEIKDFTKYLDLDEVKISKPDIFNNISFQYAEAKNASQVVFKDVFGRRYGSAVFEPNFDYAREELDLECKFGTMMPVEMNYQEATTGNILFGYGLYINRFLDESDKPIVDVPRIFYYDADLLTNTNTYILEEIDASGSTNQESLYEFPFCSMFTDFDSSGTTDSFNFSLEEPYAGIPPTNTLFQKYYSDYIQGIYDRQARVLECKMVLPLPVFYELKLSDRLFIDGYYYIVDEVTYNMKTRVAKMKLLTFFFDRSFASLEESDLDGSVSITGTPDFNKRKLWNISEDNIWRQGRQPKIQRFLGIGQASSLPRENYQYYQDIPLDPPEE